MLRTVILKQVKENIGFDHGLFFPIFSSPKWPRKLLIVPDLGPRYLHEGHPPHGSLSCLGTAAVLTHYAEHSTAANPISTETASWVVLLFAK